MDEYLAAELLSKDRHEYLGGVVYAMTGASSDHNTIAGNLFASLRAAMRGRPCRAFISDVKLRLAISEEDVFYYPDVMVACDPRDSDPYFKRFPKVLIEVLSPQTEQTDRREKFLSYIQIETLEEYVLVAQDKLEVTVFRRASKRQPEVVRQSEGCLPALAKCGCKRQPEVVRQSEDLLRLVSLDFTLPLHAVYEGVEL